MRSTCFDRGLQTDQPTHIGLNDYEIDALNTGSFARLFAHSLAHSGAYENEVFGHKLNASISYSFSPQCDGSINRWRKKTKIGGKRGRKEIRRQGWERGRNEGKEEGGMKEGKVEGKMEGLRHGKKEG